MGKRKARNKLSKKYDLMSTPITLDKIGSKDDPCFGKLHDPRHPTCQRCGDSELCCIAMGQINHLKRLKQEDNFTFKDKEEVELVAVDKKEIKKKIRSRIRELAKPPGMDIDLIMEDVHATYFNRGFTKPKIKKIIEAMLEKGRLKKSKNRLTYE